MTRIEQYLVHSAQLHAGKNAIISDGMRLSYADLLDRSARLAQSLAKGGVGEGDRVILFLDNGWELGIAVFAVWRAGAVICPVNPSTKPARLQQIVQDCQPSLIITEPRLVGHLEAMDGGIPCIVAGEGGSLRQTFESDPLPFLSRSPEALAAIIYTSGSTGLPKGVMLSHANLDAAVTSITSYLGNTSDDVILVVLPMSFGYGLNQLMSSVKVGATLVIEKSFAFPEQIYQTLEREGVTGWPIVPSIAAIMMQARELDPRRFASLRYVTCAAAPLPLAHQDWLCDFLPHADLFIMYGQTECTRATWLPPAQLNQRRGSVGIAIPGVKLKIVDEEGKELPWDGKRFGNLMVRGPWIANGYFKGEGGDVLKDGWFPTGDVATIDPDGYMQITDRSKDVIKSGGEWISSIDLENIAMAHPVVHEAAAIACRHPKWDERPLLVVVKKPGAEATAADILGFFEGRIAKWQIPDDVVFVTEIPHTATGKIQKLKLRDQFKDHKLPSA